VAGEIYKASAKDGKCADGFIGFFNESKSATETVKVAISGIETHQSSLTVGERYYLTDTAGTIGTTPGAVATLVGKAIAATKLLIYGGFINAEVIQNTPLYLISDDVYKSDDGSESVTEDQVWRKVKEFTLPANFPTNTLRIHFELKQSDGSHHAQGRIHKNGDTFGSLRDTTSATWQEYEEDLVFQAGDTIEIWAYNIGGTAAGIQNFRILGKATMVNEKYIIDTTF